MRLESQPSSGIGRNWTRTPDRAIGEGAKWQSSWYDPAMKTTIDSAGRIVVPKRLRDELGLQPGQVLELEVSDGRLQVAIAPVDFRLERRRHGPVAVSDEQLPTLTADIVRQTLERTRR